VLCVTALSEHIDRLSAVVILGSHGRHRRARSIVLEHTSLRTQPP
jgi:hypothetical protein